MKNIKPLICRNGFVQTPVPKQTPEFCLLAHGPPWGHAQLLNRIIRQAEEPPKERPEAPMSETYNNQIASYNMPTAQERKERPRDAQERPAAPKRKACHAQSSYTASLGRPQDCPAETPRAHRNFVIEIRGTTTLGRRREDPV